MILKNFFPKKNLAWKFKSEFFISLKGDSKWASPKLLFFFLFLQAKFITNFFLFSFFSPKSADHTQLQDFSSAFNHKKKREGKREDNGCLGVASESF